MKTFNLRLFLSLVLPIAAATTISCSMFIKAPPPSEFGRTRTSAGGQYRATIIPSGDSIPKNKLQSWTLHIETVDGVAVDSSQVLVAGGMPQHGHGLPTKPVVRKLPTSGDYLVQGLKFNMGGWWEVKFRVNGAAAADSIVFNIRL
jgi:hypothetical protein